MNEWMNQMKQYVWKDFVNCEMLFVGEWLSTVIITKSASSKLLWTLKLLFRSQQLGIQGTKWPHGEPQSYRLSQKGCYEVIYFPFSEKLW